MYYCNNYLQKKDLNEEVKTNLSRDVRKQILCIYLESGFQNISKKIGNLDFAAGSVCQGSNMGCQN